MELPGRKKKRTATEKIHRCNYGGHTEGLCDSLCVYYLPLSQGDRGR